MSKIRASVFALCFASAAFAGQMSLAASPSQQDCEAAGGTFSKVRGEVMCIQKEHVGKSSNSATTTNTTTGRGNIDNKQQQSCTGPGASTSSAHCK